MATGKRSAAKGDTPHPHGAIEPFAAQARYIESSALLAALLEADSDARRSIRGSGRRLTSALTLAETNRALVRARITGRISEAEERSAIRALETFARRCEVIAVSQDVLTRAGRPFPIEPIRTLDAIHLATVELLGEPPQLMILVTRDRRIADNARAMGYSVA